MMRKPLALSNWKMAMTVAESLDYVRRFEALAGDLLDIVDVIVCPPYTALWSVAEALRGSRLQLGGQNVAPTDDPARTGEISAALLVDAGCRWVMLEHWEVRRHQGDDDGAVNRKLHLALEAELAPVLLVGEVRNDAMTPEVALARHLARVLDGCQREQVATMAIVYGPQGTIGVRAPSSTEHVATGCALIRDWLRRRWDEGVAAGVRIIYGGSVAPEHAANLLAAPDLEAWVRPDAVATRRRSSR